MYILKRVTSSENHRVPLVVTEGLVKADAGVSRLGVCVVGIAGVWCWRGSNEDGGKTVLADWEHIVLNDREIIVVFDSDVMMKRSVHDALVRLGALLQRRGLRAFITPISRRVIVGSPWVWTTGWP